ncbi:MAG: trigger factor [bacterium]|nr:trigger factor [bacterium]
MNITEKKLENATVELQIEVPVEKVEIEYKAVFDKIKQNVKIDGFRKGKAPVQMVETHYREYADQDVAENLVRSAFLDAITEKQLTPIAEPQYEFDVIKRDELFSFKAVFEIPPTVELGNYKSIAAEEKSCVVTEEEVMSEVDTVRERHADLTEKGEGALLEEGNLTKIMVKRTDDGAEVSEDGTADFKDYSIVIGKSKDKYALDKHLVGMKVGEEKEVDVKYPRDYTIKDLAGQKVSYLVRIEKIEDMKLPELDDEFAKKVEYESKDDMIVKTREYIEKYVLEKTRGDAKALIIKEIVENSTYDIPATMVKSEMKSMLRRRLQEMGFPPENMEHFESQLDDDNSDFPADFKEQLRGDADNSIKTTLTLAEIAKNEELSVPEEKFKEVVERIAKRGGQTPEEVEKLIADNNTRENIEHELILDESMDFVYENGKIKKLKPIPLEELLADQ